MMFKTFQGVTEDSASEVYLRPETAQGIFVNFKNIQRTTRRKVPFGVAQVGKSFRNEITPETLLSVRASLSRWSWSFSASRAQTLSGFDYWRGFCRDWLIGLNMREENLRLRDHEPEELSHYSKATTDFEFLFPFGWGELWGVADRTDFDLSAHQKESGESMEYFDQESGEKYVPYVVEPSLGADRVTLAFLVDAYDEEVVDPEKNDVRTVLRLHPALAPFKCAVLPLSKKLGEQAGEVRRRLARPLWWTMTTPAPSASATAARTRSAPLCVTYDFDSETDGCVTVRDRDSMAQVRIPSTNWKPISPSASPTDPARAGRKPWKHRTGPANRSRSLPTAPAAAIPAGGWAAILRWGGFEKELSGGEAGDDEQPHGADRRHRRPVRAQGALHRPPLFRFQIPHRRRQPGLAGQVAGQGMWRRQGNEPVKNEDLWKRLCAAMEPHCTAFVWVRGHDGHPENERCDALATACADAYDTRLQAR